MTEKHISDGLDGLIETWDRNGTERVINIKQLLLFRYICTNYEISIRSQI